MLKFIKSGDAKGTRVDIDLPAGRWAFLKLTITGTSDTAQTATADIGEYRLERNGREIHGADLLFTHQYADLKGGHPTLVAPTAGATRITTFIPFGLFGVPNTLDIASKEECDLELRFNSNLSTIFGSNAVTYTLQGYSAPSIPERYELNISKQNISASGASREKEVLNRQNIASLYLRDAGSVVDRIQYVADGEVIEDNVTDDDLRDISNFLNQVESAQTLAEINMVNTSIVEAQNKFSELEANFTGSGTLDVVVMSINYGSPAVGRSQSAVEARLREKVSAIQAQGGSGISAVPSGAVRNPQLQVAGSNR